MASSNGAAAAADAQDGLFDQEIDDPSLIEALEEREKLRAAKAKATAKYTEKHDAVKARLGELNIEPGDVVRVGRFRVKKTETESRAVAFETSASTRMTITLLDG